MTKRDFGPTRTQLWMVVTALALGAGVACRTPGPKGSRVANDLSATATPRPSAAERAKWHVRMGLSLEDDAGGVRVRDVAPAEFASVIGVQGGDVITHLNGQPVSGGVAGFQKTADALVRGSFSGAWVLTVKRDGASRALAAAPEYDCNPFDLIGCGSLSEKDRN